MNTGTTRKIVIANDKITKKQINQAIAEGNTFAKFTNKGVQKRLLKQQGRIQRQQELREQKVKQYTKKITAAAQQRVDEKKRAAEKAGAHFIAKDGTHVPVSSEVAAQVVKGFEVAEETEDIATTKNLSEHIMNNDVAKMYPERMAELNKTPNATTDTATQEFDEYTFETEITTTLTDKPTVGEDGIHQLSAGLNHLNAFEGRGSIVGADGFNVAARPDHPLDPLLKSSPMDLFEPDADTKIFRKHVIKSIIAEDVTARALESLDVPEHFGVLDALPGASKDPSQRAMPDRSVGEPCRYSDERGYPTEVTNALLDLPSSVDAVAATPDVGTDGKFVPRAGWKPTE